VQLVLVKLGYWALADLFVHGLVSQHKAVSKTIVIRGSSKPEVTPYTSNAPYYQQQSICITEEAKNIKHTIHSLIAYIMSTIFHSRKTVINYEQNKKVTCKCANYEKI
jgi:hypothetical protein